MHNPAIQLIRTVHYNENLPRLIFFDSLIVSRLEKSLIK